MVLPALGKMFTSLCKMVMESFQYLCTCFTGFFHLFFVFPYFFLMNSLSLCGKPASETFKEYVREASMLSKLADSVLSSKLFIQPYLKVIF